MTTEEKIEIIKAFSEGKPIEVYNEDEDMWEAKIRDDWDFEEGKYRKEPEAAAKFKAGDVLLAKKDEHQASPTRFEVTDIKLGHYCFKDHLDTPIIDVDKNYIDERDVLWYFEVYDSHQGRWSIFDVGRLTIDEMTKEYAPYDDHIHKFRPFYTLGFSMRELNDNG